MEEFFHHFVTALQLHLASVMTPGILDFPFWFAREMVWWWVVARLCSLVVAFVLSTPLAQSLRPVTVATRHPGEQA